MPYQLPKPELMDIIPSKAVPSHSLESSSPVVDRLQTNYHMPYGDSMYSEQAQSMEYYHQPAYPPNFTPNYSASDYSSSYPGRPAVNHLPRQWKQKDESELLKDVQQMMFVPPGTIVGNTIAPGKTIVEFDGKKTLLVEKQVEKKYLLDMFEKERKDLAAKALGLPPKPPPQPPAEKNIDFGWLRKLGKKFSKSSSSSGGEGMLTSSNGYLEGLLSNVCLSPTAAPTTIDPALLNMPSMPSSVPTQPVFYEKPQTKLPLSKSEFYDEFERQLKELEGDDLDDYLNL